MLLTWLGTVATSLEHQLLTQSPLLPVPVPCSAKRGRWFGFGKKQGWNIGRIMENLLFVFFLIFQKNGKQFESLPQRKVFEVYAMLTTCSFGLGNGLKLYRLLLAQEPLHKAFVGQAMKVARLVCECQDLCFPEVFEWKKKYESSEKKVLEKKMKNLLDFQDVWNSEVLASCLLFTGNAYGLGCHEIRVQRPTTQLQRFYELIGLWVKMGWLPPKTRFGKRKHEPKLLFPAGFSFWPSPYRT